MEEKSSKEIDKSEHSNKKTQGIVQINSRRKKGRGRQVQLQEADQFMKQPIVKIVNLKKDLKRSYQKGFLDDRKFDYIHILRKIRRKGEELDSVSSHYGSDESFHINDSRPKSKNVESKEGIKQKQKSKPRKPKIRQQEPKKPKEITNKKRGMKPISVDIQEKKKGIQIEVKKTSAKISKNNAVKQQLIQSSESSSSQSRQKDIKFQQSIAKLTKVQKSVKKQEVPIKTSSNVRQKAKITNSNSSDTSEQSQTLSQSLSEESSNSSQTHISSNDNISSVKENKISKKGQAKKSNNQKSSIEVQKDSELQNSLKRTTEQSTKLKDQARNELIDKSLMKESLKPKQMVNQQPGKQLISKIKDDQSYKWNNRQQNKEESYKIILKKQIDKMEGYDHSIGKNSIILENKIIEQAERRSKIDGFNQTNTKQKDLKMDKNVIELSLMPVCNRNNSIVPVNSSQTTQKQNNLVRSKRHQQSENRPIFKLVKHQRDTAQTQLYPPNSNRIKYRKIIIEQIDSNQSDDEPINERRVIRRVIKPNYKRNVPKKYPSDDQPLDFRVNQSSGKEKKRRKLKK